MESIISDPDINSNVIEPKYIMASLFLGVVVKLYDDLVDNPLLQPYKNDYLLEFLKGLFFIIGTFISLGCSSFFITLYVGNFLAFCADPDVWALPYEKSVLFSTPLLFLFINYSDIEILKLFTNSYIVDLIFGTIMLCLILLEVRFFKVEFSHSKLYFRTFIVLCFIALLFCCKGKFIKYLIYFIIGYCFVSVGVQFYSLHIHKTPTNKENLVKKEEADVLQKKE